MKRSETLLAMATHLRDKWCEEHASEMQDTEYAMFSIVDALKQAEAMLTYSEQVGLVSGEWEDE